MGYKRAAVVGAVFMATLLTGFGFAATSTELQEANLFFSGILQRTQNPVIAAMMQENLARLSGKQTRTMPARQVEVPLLPRTTGSLQVTMLINRRAMGAFVVDTGATYTVITPRLARQLGIIPTVDTPRMPITTANGVIYAPVVTLKAAAIGSVEVKNVPAVIQELDPANKIAGLLGMSFFNGMDVTIKRDRLVLSLSEPTSAAAN